jgi:hypothetical protein
LKTEALSCGNVWWIQVDQILEVRGGSPNFKGLKILSQATCELAGIGFRREFAEL